MRRCLSWRAPSSAVIVGLVAPSRRRHGRLRARWPRAATGVPKVVLVVGPAGGRDRSLPAEARTAAALARKYTPDVTEIYSPNATWPAVRGALQGASVVIYMGHGNGWPSRYRDELYPPSQNGFGLNPTTGAGDGTHQYFGEGPIAESIRLAPNAVVLLNHLCYASGTANRACPRARWRSPSSGSTTSRRGFIVARAAAGRRRGVRQPEPHVAIGPGRARRHRVGLAPRPERQRQPFRLRERAQSGLRRRDGPGPSRSGFTRSIVLKKGSRRATSSPRPVVGSGAAATQASKQCAGAQPRRYRPRVEDAAPPLDDGRTAALVPDPVRRRRPRPLPRGCRPASAGTRSIRLQVRGRGAGMRRPTPIRRRTSVWSPRSDSATSWLRRRSGSTASTSRSASERRPRPVDTASP